MKSSSRRDPDAAPASTSTPAPGSGAYDAPADWVNLNELAARGPADSDVPLAPIYTRHSPEQARSWAQDQQQRRRRRSSGGGDSEREPGEGGSPVREVPPRDAIREPVSRLTTETYTVSYLILFAIFGTLARVGLAALTSYTGNPVVFSSVWPNFAGCVIMGFLTEDRMLFRDEWGTPTYDQLIALAKLEHDGSSRSTQPQSRAVDLVAAKNAHLATKKTIPLYIGLTTGFCGSFTSFSAFIRDVFLAVSNSMVFPGYDIPVERNGGDSFMALVAVILTTTSLSIAGFFIGSHIAMAVERFTPSIPFPVTRKFLDPLSVVLGWGCWLGAVLMAVLPPANRWRGEILFSLVFGPLGCLLRFYLSVHLNGKIPAFPLGTFTANVFGTAVLGMAFDIAHVPIGGRTGCQVLQGIEDGFCGCLTTISTAVLELVTLKRQHAYIYGLTGVVVATAIMIAIMGGLRWTEGFHGLECQS
ncbi:UPF0695 membrane protein [Escovopsis weberi]|uniref:UPF0695 membrane protein n=1 Tax=Escovopsis weberi TaxID=150374 RepID=A0A0M9VVA6_ESCWE|nr:UPF0695 membrane protein [Escovopsis weberi]